MQHSPTLEEALEVVSGLSALDKVRLVQKMMLTLETTMRDEHTPSKPSLLGIWSGVEVSSADIDQVRAEMMLNFPREDI